MAKNILNLTGYKATKEQLSAGLVNVEDEDSKRVKEIFTIPEVTNESIKTAIDGFVEILDKYPDFDEVAIAPPNFLASSIEAILKKKKKTVVYPIVKIYREKYTSLSGKTITKKITEHKSLVYK